MDTTSAKGAVSEAPARVPPLLPCHLCLCALATNGWRRSDVSPLELQGDAHRILGKAIFDND